MPLTTQEIRDRININGHFMCEDLICENCPFFTRDSSTCDDAFDLKAMKAGTEETLPELMKYYITPEFPNMK